MVKHVACEVVSQLVLARLVSLGVNVGVIAVATTRPKMNEVTAAPATMPFSEVLDCLRSVSSSVFVGIVLYSMMPELMFGACAGASSAAAARAARARYAKHVARVALNDNHMSKCETASAHEARESSARPRFFIKELKARA